MSAHFSTPDVSSRCSRSSLSGLATFAGLGVPRTPPPPSIHEWTCALADTRPAIPISMRRAAPGSWAVRPLPGLARPSAEKFERIPPRAAPGPQPGRGRRRRRLFSGNLKGYIGRLDPATGAIKRFPMPDPAAKDPHTLIFGRGGELLFHRAGRSFVGRLDPKSGRCGWSRFTDGRSAADASPSTRRAPFSTIGTREAGHARPCDAGLKEYALARRRAGAAPHIAITSDDGLVRRLRPR